MKPTTVLQLFNPGTLQLATMIRKLQGPGDRLMQPLIIVTFSLMVWPKKEIQLWELPLLLITMRKLSLYEHYAITVFCSYMPVPTGMVMAVSLGFHLD